MSDGPDFSPVASEKHRFGLVGKIWQRDFRNRPQITPVPHEEQAEVKTSPATFLERLLAENPHRERDIPFPSDLFAHQGLDFSSSAREPRLREFIADLSHRRLVGWHNFSTEVPRSDLPNTHYDWKGIKFGIDSTNDGIHHDGVSFTAQMAPKIPVQDSHDSWWFKQEYKKMTDLLIEKFGGQVEIITVVPDRVSHDARIYG